MKFICDIMLGMLAKHLRIVGMDTSYSSFFTLSQIITAASAEQRTILTRRTDQLLSEQQTASFFFIQSNYPFEQLQDVIRQFNLQTDSSRFFTRCLLCNQLLHTVDKASVAGIVPAYVFSTTNYFARCALR